MKRENNNIISIRDIAHIKGIILPDEIDKNEFLTSNKKQEMIDEFLKKKEIFNKKTPNFILEDIDCIKSSISLNINSVNFVKYLPESLYSYVIDLALKENFVITKNSPSCLKTNPKIILESIKRNKKTIRFIEPYIKEHKDILKYLLENGCSFDLKYIKMMPIDYFFDEDVMKYFLEQLNLFIDDNPKYKCRLTKLCIDSIKKDPLIKDFDNVFEAILEKDWKEYRESETNNKNIFGKICTNLRNSNTFDEINKLDFLDDMSKILGEKYNDLYNAMKEYFYFYHSNIENKMDKIKYSQDIISRLSALYIAKEKSLYINDKLKSYKDWIRKFFKLKIDNPIINKRITEIKQKEKLKELYINNSIELNSFIESLKYKYNLDNSIFKLLIDSFVINNISKIESIIKPPILYNDYKKYKESIKLINRLNSGYIKYSDQELNNYREIITYDEIKNKYIYIGINITKEVLEECENYIYLKNIFEKIKKDIIFKTKNIDIENYQDELILKDIEREIPFNDEYFCFNKDYYSEIYFIYFIQNFLYYNKFNVNNFLSDEIYSNIYNIIINNKIIWLLLFMGINYNYNLIQNINQKNIYDLINNMDNITRISKEFNFNLNNYKEVILVHKFSRCSSSSSMAILGKEVIEKLLKKKERICNGDDIVIFRAKELVCKMSKRNKSTVPYIEGEYMNYKYSMFDPLDPNILLAGIYTDSCFGIKDIDNDFLYYCALDKNGFVIKITDNLDNFIARASGFRHGNCVLINQLRTIYDERGDDYYGISEYETNDIISTFKKACFDIVNISQNNNLEKDKIDFVFVTASAALSNYETNIPNDIYNMISDGPMDTISDDWDTFVSSSDNLQDSKEYGFFTTDFPCYPVILISSSKNIYELSKQDIQFKNVDALYERKRNKIIVSDKISKSIILKINRIKAIKSFFTNKTFKPIEYFELSKVFVGDNWYIIASDNNIIDYCLLEFDNKAVLEFNATIDVLSKNNNKVLIKK